MYQVKIRFTIIVKVWSHLTLVVVDSDHVSSQANSGKQLQISWQLDIINMKSKQGSR